MKKQLLEFTATVLLAISCVAWVSTVSLDDLAASHIRTMQADGTIKKVVNTMLADGTLCQLIGGHKWRLGCNKEGCLVVHQDQMRHCVICEKAETQQLAPWR